MMSDVNGYTGFRRRQPEVLRERTARQLWQTLAVAFPGVFTDVRPRRVDEEEKSCTCQSGIVTQPASVMSILDAPIVNSLVAFVGLAVQGTNALASTSFDLSNDSPTRQNFEARFLADCQETSAQYWELCLDIHSMDDGKIGANNKAALMNRDNQPLTGVELVVFSEASRKVLWKKIVSGPLMFDQSDLKTIYMQSLTVRFPDGSLQSGKLASVSPVS